MLFALREALRLRLHNVLHHGEVMAHGLYFGLVFVEGHGFYAMVAGLLFVVVVIRVLLRSI